MNRWAALLSLTLGGLAVNAEATAPVEQAVIVRFDYGHKDWSPFFAFEEKLEHAVDTSGLGDYDGNELAVDGSDGTMFIYGPDADKLLALIEPLVESAGILKNVRATLRYGA